MLRKKFLIPRLFVSGVLTFVTYQKIHSAIAPEPYDFNIKKDKRKNIIVVGGGMVGLTTAYFLAKGYP